MRFVLESPPREVPMTALAALVLLASSTVRAEDLLAPGTMICTCTPAAATASAPPVAAEEAPAPSWHRGRLGLYAAATSLPLFGGSVAAPRRPNHPTPPPGGNPRKPPPPPP